MNIPIVFGILIELLNSKQVKSSYLAEKFKVSTRTVFRYVNVLAEAGVPVCSQTGKNGGISIIPDYKLDAMYFTKKEMKDLVSAIEILKIDKPDFANYEVLTAKLNATANCSTACNILESDKIVVDGGAWGDLKKYRSKANVIEQAINKSESVTIEYHDRGNSVSVREIEPYLFLLKNSVWYVYAYCRLKQSFKTFKLSRITKIAPNDTPYKKRSFPQNKPWTLGSDSNEPTVELILNCSHKVRYDIEEWLGIESVTVENDKCTARAEIKENAELIGKLLSFGNEISVVSPKRIKDKIYDVCKSIIASYK